MNGKGRLDERSQVMSQSEIRVNFEINIHYNTCAKSFPMVKFETKQQRNLRNNPRLSRKS